MNYEEIFSMVTQIMIIAGIIALAISLVTEFWIKAVFKNMPAVRLNVVVTVLSLVITFICMIAYSQIKSINLLWYMYVGILFLGFLVAIIAMNGYDKIFSYVYQWIRNMFGKTEGV